MEWKSRKRLVLLTVAALSLASAGLIWASAADNTRVVIICPAGKHTHTCSLNGGSKLTMSTEGSLATAVGERFTTSDGRQGTHLEVVEIKSLGSMEGVGEVEFTLDTSRTVGSTIIANQADADFPATQTMRFYPKITLEGQEFYSSEPAQVMNSEVTSFPPAPGTIYVLTHELTMTSEGGDVLVIDPGNAFTVGEEGD